MKKTITPEFARELLLNNKVNRPVNNSNVAFLVSEILKGNFKYNGEPIIISKCGMLIDGQHRLYACVEANTPIKANIVDDVELDSMATIDTGRNRTAADVFSIKSIPDSTFAAAFCNITLKKFDTVTNSNSTESSKKAGRVKFSNLDQLNFYNFNRNDIHALLTFTSRLYEKGVKVITKPRIAGFIYLFAFEDFYAAVDFFREVILGITIRESNVALILRNKLINDKISISKISDKSKRDLIIKAFRIYKKNESRKVLSVKKDEVLLFSQNNLSQSKPDIDINFLSKF